MPSIFRVVPLFCVLLAPSLFAGKIVVNHDEWTMSSSALNGGVLAVNIANWFSPGGPGSFLVYTNNFGLDNSTFLSALASGGHTVSVNPAAPFTLPGLSAYNGVFLGGYIGSYNAGVLTSYVNAGGNVYLMGGTGAVAAEDSVWDGFLNNFGFDFGASYNGIGGTFLVTSAHPIFSGISSLYYNNGNTVNLYGSNPFAFIAESYNGQGLIGIYDDTARTGTVPEPASAALTASALLALGWLVRRQRARLARTSSRI
jgi:hypothetical protein